MGRTMGYTRGLTRRPRQMGPTVVKLAKLVIRRLKIGMGRCEGGMHCFCTTFNVRGVIQIFKCLGAI